MVRLTQFVHDPLKIHYEPNEARTIATDLGAFDDEVAAQAHAVEVHKKLRTADKTKIITFSIESA
jgi:hypothetical protein